MFGGDLNLYSEGKNKPKVATGFANADIAKQTLKNIKHLDINYQKYVVITMYNRAKYHPYRNKSMLDAMTVYSKWMKKNSIKIVSSSRTKKISRTKSISKTKTKSKNKTISRS
jgi:hypothetical protein